jgi:iron complex outermembrane recepter protein
MKISDRHNGISALTIAVSTFACVAPALAQNGPVPQATDPSSATSTQSGLSDIIVTAERRSTNIQKTPLSISAVSGEDLRSHQITNIESLSQNLPNVSFGKLAADARVYIRGVGYDSVSTGGETRVALYNDGVYQSRSQAAFAGFFDVDRVEVLRGPQGTLYGRNATAGAINIISRDPGNTLNGYVSGTVGTYRLIGVEGAVGGPLGNGVSARIAVRSTDREGYGRNIQTGNDVGDEHSRAVRAKVRAKLSSDFTIQIVGNYSREKDHTGGYRFLGAGRSDMVPLPIVLGVAPSHPQDTAGAGPDFRLELYGVSATATWSPSADTQIVSVSGYNHVDSRLLDNFDGTTAGLSVHRLNERSNSFSQELRVQQNFGDFADLIVGAYYFHEKNLAENLAALNGIFFGLPFGLRQGYGTRGTVKTDAYALFGQATMHLTSRLGVTLGGRYSDESKIIDEAAQFDLVRPYDPANPLLPFGTAQQKTKQSSFDPKITIDYRFTDDIFGYATYSRGFKSGGFNIGGLQPPFEAERLTNYEVGIKSEFFDHRLRANVSAFYYDYSNLQVNVNEGVALVTRNAAKARIKGVEAEFLALPVDGLRLGLNFAYLDAKYRKFDTIDDTFPELGIQNLSGNRLNNAPKYKIDGEIGYTFRTAVGDFTPRANVTWVDRVYFSQFNLPQVSQPSRTEVNLYLNYERPGTGWSASVYVRNATDKTYVVASTIGSLFAFPLLGQFAPPRTVGLQITKAF